MTAAVALPTHGLIRTLRVGASALVAALIAGIAATIAACAVTGSTPLVVVSGSMAPAIDVGDLIIVRATSVEEVAASQVVTFRDDTRGGQLVTHRVVSITRNEGGYDVVTQGDRNTAVEEWSVAPDGTVGRYVLRVPRVGLVANAAAQPAVLLFGFLSALALGALRFIWRS